jgi:hypothetical protein
MAEKIQWLYTIIQNFVAFITLMTTIIYWKKIKQNDYFTLFPVYIFFTLLISCVWFFRKQIDFPGRLIQNIFLPFEFFTFYNFFLKVLKGRKNYFLLITLSILFFVSTIIVITYLYSTQTRYPNIISFANSSIFPEIIVIENILIVIPVLAYYISLFNQPYIRSLSTDPVFLVMTGILFYGVISIPLFAFQNIMMNNYRALYMYLYVINSITYIIMYLFFIKAFKSIK